MKKLSISLFAVLAIVFATSSAFTTQKTTKANDSGYFFIKSTEVGSPDVAASYEVADVFASTGDVTTEDGDCLTSVLDEVCAAKWEYTGTNPSTITGDLPIGEYMYRSN